MAAPSRRAAAASANGASGSRAKHSRKDEGGFGGKSLFASFVALQLVLGAMYLPIQEVLMGKKEIWELANPEAPSGAYIGGSSVEWSVGADGNAEDRLLAFENGWLDLGEGCCRNPEAVAFAFDAKFEGLEACKAHCLTLGNCGYVEYGWADSQACRALPPEADCSRRDQGAFDCGSAGNSGVHAYRNLKAKSGMVPVAAVAQPQVEPRASDKDVGESSEQAGVVKKKGPAILPVDVTLPETWIGPYDGPAERQEARADIFGFYLPVFNQVPGVLVLLRNVRQFYPDEPIFLLSDGGRRDFGGICRMPRYNCTFEFAPPENCRWNPHCWLARMRLAAIRLRTDYIIYLEPDVIVRRRHNIQPAHDAGGLYDNFNPRMHHETTFFMQKRGQQVNPCFKVRWHHFGLAGGSYFRTAAVLDAFDPKFVSTIDWDGLGKKEGKRVHSSDFAMHVAFSQRGYVVFPWKEVSQKFTQGMRDKAKDVDDTTFGLLYPSFNKEAAFEHNHKEKYNAQKMVSPEEETAMGPKLPEGAQTTCTGCVWYEGGIPGEGRTLPIPSAPPTVSQEDIFDPSALQHGEMHPDAPEPDDVCVAGGARDGPTAVAPGAGAEPRVAADEGEGGGEQEPPVSPPAGAPDNAVSRDTEVKQPITRLPPAVENAMGLPVSPDPPPSWLSKADDLIVDLPQEVPGGRKMLLAQTVLMNKNNVWGDSSSGERVTRPRWLRACLASNRAHTATHGHAHILRTRETLTIPERLSKPCQKQADPDKCLRSAAHETFNWEKHTLMLEYLRSPQNFSHIMVLDADAALVNHAHDTMALMAAELAASGKDFLLTNEDWMGPGSGEKRINGGMLFAANTPFTHALFADMLDAHFEPEGILQPRLGGKELKCHGNEQICLNGIQKREDVVSRFLITSGRRFNRGGCVLTRCGNGQGDPDLQMKNAGLRDPTVEIMHFVGNSKFVAPKAICDESLDLTWDGMKGYGCKE